MSGSERRNLEAVNCISSFGGGAHCMGKTSLSRSVMASVIHMDHMSRNFSSLCLITVWWMSVSLKPSNASSALKPNSGCTAWEVKAYRNLTDIMNTAVTPIFYTRAIMYCTSTLKVTPRLTSRLSHWHTSDSDCTVNYPSTFHGPGVGDREWVHPCIQPTPAMPPPEVKPICRRGRQEDIGLFFFSM